MVSMSERNGRLRRHAENARKQFRLLARWSFVAPLCCAPAFDREEVFLYSFLLEKVALPPPRRAARPGLSRACGASIIGLNPPTNWLKTTTASRQQRYSLYNMLKTL